MTDHKTKKKFGPQNKVSTEISLGILGAKSTPVIHNLDA